MSIVRCDRHKHDVLFDDQYIVHACDRGERVFKKSTPPRPAPRAYAGRGT